MNNLYIRVRNLSLIFTSLLIFIFTLGASEPGTIYVMICSDTAIWDGMGVSTYNDNYNPELYIYPSGNTYTIMNPSFRSGFRDSFGDTLSITWYMMAGNIFRYAVNTDMPYPNIMTMYFMKKYYENEINIVGDELSLHYHTFVWTDYDHDGKYWWNQALNFMESYDDFNFTLAQLFLEEQVFPVSFRSGWHYMDNEWQNYLNKLLPYSYHNDHPNKRTDTTEPLDNTYDWSLSPSVFIPYNPSPENYQLPGNSKGWNVRSIHLNSIKNNNSMWNSVFAKADSGTSQVVCIWGHLPEEDFVTNIAAVDSALHHYTTVYPLVRFKYCTGIEAMQNFRGGTDTQKPLLNVQQSTAGNHIKFDITTDEPIFQEQPFVAYKDLNEKFHVADCISTGINSWSTTLPVESQLISKAGVILTDTMGNQSYQVFRYLPDDIYVDNKDAGYLESYGNWTDNPAYAWGNNSRKASLGGNDSARVRWNFNITQNSYYHIYTQFPSQSNPAGKIIFRILSQGGVVDSIYFENAPQQKKWLYLTTKNLNAGNYSVEMTIKGTDQGGKTITADVIKVSPLVREKAIKPIQESIRLGEFALSDHMNFYFDVMNNGTGSLTISGVTSVNNIAGADTSLPVIINSMQTLSLKMKINVTAVGSYTDTIFIHSDDPLVPMLSIPFSVKVIPYFVIIDDLDSLNYHETRGSWAFSVAQAYGPTSRYAYLNQSPLASAYFVKTLEKEGDYVVSVIVPTTVNAATNALYKFYVNGVYNSFVYIDQNQNSGNWVMIKRITLPAGTVFKTEVVDPGNSSGAVLRADAVKVGIYDPSLYAGEESGIPSEFAVYQNYPNPFNPSTKIRYAVPDGFADKKISLVIYDIMGQRIRTLYEGIKSPGVYEAEFNGSAVSSGIYFCRLNAGGHSSVIKMLLLK